MKVVIIVALVLSCLSCSPEMGGKIISKYHTDSTSVEMWEHDIKIIKTIEPTYYIKVEFKGDTMDIPIDYNSYKSIQINDYYDLNK